MNNHKPLRREILDAYEALETLTDTCIHSSEQAEELRDLVRLVLPPLPNPTMAEIAWDNDEHRLAEALHPKYGKVAMLDIGIEKEWILIMYWDEDEDEADYRTVGLADLEPTGKHYFRTDKD